MDATEEALGRSLTFKALGSTSMSEGKLLARAVLDHPGEDTPKLVYADWLDENGQPELAARIRTPRLGVEERRSWAKSGRWWKRHVCSLVTPPFPKNAH